MNCPDCRDRLQQWLDGRTRDSITPGELPALCPSCAEWTAAARRFDRSLRLLTAPTPPPYLTARIVSRVVSERRSRRYRILLVVGVAATAAMLLLAVWQGLHGFGLAPAPPSGPPPLVQAPTPEHPSPQASLRDSMAEAGSAMAALTARTADETVAKTKILMPVVADPALGQLDLEPPSLDPSGRALREAGESVTAGLEPVTDSARRAVGLFLRELPPMDAPPKSGF